MAWQNFGPALRRSFSVVDRVARVLEVKKQEKALRKLKLPPQVEYKAPQPEDGMTTVTVNCTTCAICLEDFQEGEMCIVLPVCNHVFHSACIKPWLIKKQKCPNCRVSLTNHKS
ncbi:hypothetical protein NMG60_11030717 [Bertholletia excelsa]